MRLAWNLSSSRPHGWLECVYFPVKKIWNQFDIGLNIDMRIYLVFEVPRRSFRYYFATIQGDRLASIDFFTEKKTESSSWNLRCLHFKPWQSARAGIFSRLARKWLQKDISARQTTCTGSKRRTGGRLWRMVDLSDLLFSASHVDEGSLQIQRFIVKGKQKI